MSSVVDKWKALKSAEKPAPQAKSPIDFAEVLRLSTLPRSEADVIAANRAGASRCEDFSLSVQLARNDADRQRARDCLHNEQKQLRPWGDAERSARRDALLALRAREADVRAVFRQTADRWLVLENLREHGAFGPQELAEHNRLRVERELLYRLVGQVFKAIPQELRSLVPAPIGEALKQFEDVASALGRVPKLDADPAVTSKVAAVTQHVSARHQVLADAALNKPWAELEKLAQSE